MSSSNYSNRIVPRVFRSIYESSIQTERERERGGEGWAVRFLYKRKLSRIVVINAITIVDISFASFRIQYIFYQINK